MKDSGGAAARLDRGGGSCCRRSNTDPPVQKTPTPLQQWLKGCYFGKPDKEVVVRKSWAEEEKAFKEMLGAGMTDEEKQARGKAQADDGRVRANAG